jgi:serine/threonine-protein kinase
MWGNTFDRAAEEVVSIQDQIASAIVDEGIRLRLSGDERRALVNHPTNAPEAYEWYLRARHAVLQQTEEGTLQARELLIRATARDPQFVLAYSALAGTYIGTAIDGFERPVEAIPEARRILRRVLDIDPQLPEARGPAAAIAFFFDWDWATAEREWNALNAFPSSALPIQELVAQSLARWVLTGPADGLRVVRKLREADPLTVSYAVLEADYLFHSGQLDAAAALYEKSLHDTSTANALFGLAEVRRAQGRFDEALDARRRAHEASGDDSLLEVFDTARGAEGYRLVERTAVEFEVEALRARATTAYVSPLDFARAHAQLGNREPAFSYFDAAFADRAPGLVFLKVDRAWDPVRDDPRFADAVRRVGLPGT